MSCMEGKVWIRYARTDLHTYESWEGEAIFYTHKLFHGPFDTLGDALDYLRGVGWKGVEIYDFT